MNAECLCLGTDACTYMCTESIMHAHKHRKKVMPVASSIRWVERVSDKLTTVLGLVLPRHVDQSSS